MNQYIPLSISGKTKMNNISLQDIENIDFWRSLNPSLTISSTPFSGSSGSEIMCDEGLAGRMRQQVIEDGYFQTPVIIDKDDTSILRDVVLNLHKNNIMPVFASLYDEYWQMLYKLRDFYKSFMLDDYQLVPDFWIWHVAADDNVSGWKPHRDGGMDFSSIRNDGTPTLTTVWIALTDVTTSNSCMYVLPRKHDAIFQDFVQRKFGQPGIPNAREIPVSLPKVRALPIDAGATIGWDTNIFHWGSASSKWADEPRISTGIYYQSADAPNIPPVFDDSDTRFVKCLPETGLSFENRLTILANILNAYLDKFDVDGERDQHFTDVIRVFQDKWNRY